MTAIDPFTAATPTYRRAQMLAARPMPLLAGEVAEYRRVGPGVRLALLRFAGLLTGLGVLIALWSVLP